MLKIMLIIAIMGIPAYAIQCYNCVDQNVSAIIEVFEDFELRDLPPLCSKNGADVIDCPTRCISANITYVAASDAYNGLFYGCPENFVPPLEDNKCVDVSEGEESFCEHRPLMFGNYVDMTYKPCGEDNCNAVPVYASRLAFDEEVDDTAGAVGAPPMCKILFYACLMTAFVR